VRGSRSGSCLNATSSALATAAITNQHVEPVYACEGPNPAHALNVPQAPERRLRPEPASESSASMRSYPASRRGAHAATPIPCQLTTLRAEQLERRSAGLPFDVSRSDAGADRVSADAPESSGAGAEGASAQTSRFMGEAKLSSDRKPSGRTAARSPYRYQRQPARPAGRAGPRRGCYGSESEERPVTGQQPKIDLENMPAPAEGILVTHFLIVRNVARSRAFYGDVLGGQVVLEENPCIVKLANSWIIMNPGGGPTPDKPGISVVPYEPSNEVSTFLNLRVADIHACYRDWKAKGADFVTEPIDRVAEVRCYMRDPDGYLIEVGQATGMLEGKFAQKRPEDLPG
jgi:catechol 2,3-dioxygenase-like lactoylglutathione lyase family enzyme